MHKQGKDSVPFVQVSAKSNLKKEPSRYKETNACIGEWGRAIRFSCIIFQLLKTPNVFYKPSVCDYLANPSATLPVFEKGNIEMILQTIIWDTLHG